MVTDERGTGKSEPDIRFTRPASEEIKERDDDGGDPMRRCIVVGLAGVLGYVVVEGMGGHWGLGDHARLAALLAGVTCTGVAMLLTKFPRPLSLASRDHGMYTRVKMMMDRVRRSKPAHGPGAHPTADRAWRVCREACKDLDATMLRPLYSLRWYSAYDAVWERIAEIRHELCEFVDIDELSVLEVEIMEDIEGYVEPEKKEETRQRLKDVMYAIREDPGSLELRADLKQLSKLAGDSRQECWRKVNRLRGRLLVSCVGLSLVLGLLIWQLPGVLTGPGTSTRPLFLAAVFGAAGGLLSGLMVQESSVLPSRVFYVEQLLLAMRPIVGALSGLLLYLLQVTHAFPIGTSDESSNLSYFIAFAGGFSERLLLARLAGAARADRGVSKPDSRRASPGR